MVKPSVRRFSSFVLVVVAYLLGDLLPLRFFDQLCFLARPPFEIGCLAHHSAIVFEAVGVELPVLDGLDHGAPGFRFVSAIAESTGPRERIDFIEGTA